MNLTWSSSPTFLPKLSFHKSFPYLTETLSGRFQNRTLTPFAIFFRKLRLAVSPSSYQVVILDLDLTADRLTPSSCYTRLHSQLAVHG